jgi:hypothetical protein
MRRLATVLPVVLSTAAVERLIVGDSSVWRRCTDAHIDLASTPLEKIAWAGGQTIARGGLPGGSRDDSSVLRALHGIAHAADCGGLRCLASALPPGLSEREVDCHVTCQRSCGLAPAVPSLAMCVSARCPALQRLRLVLRYGCEEVRDWDIASLATLTGLSSLDLEHSNVTDTGVTRLLIALPGLVHLGLNRSPRLSRSCFAEIAAAAPAALTRLELAHLSAHVTLTDHSLAHLGALTRLQDLDLFSTSFGGMSDAVFARLAALTGLTRPAMPHMDDAAARRMSRLIDLRHLAVCFSTISNVGLTYGAMCTGLEYLEMHSNEHGDLDPGRRVAWVSDDVIDLSPLAALTHLVNLGLGLCRQAYDPRATRHLTCLTKLSYLELARGHRLDDIGVPNLAVLTNLRELEVSSVRMPLGAVPTPLQIARPWLPRPCVPLFAWSFCESARSTR